MEGLEKELASYIIEWLQSRNGGELRGAFADMRLGSYQDMREELELILKHGGKPPNWVR